MVGIALIVVVVLSVIAYYSFDARSSPSIQRDGAPVGRLPQDEVVTPAKISFSAPEITDEFFEGVVWEAHGDRIQKAFYTKIAGASFRNDDGSSRRDAIDLCVPLDVLTPKHEPDNRYDPNAIAIYSPHGVQIGYIERRLAGEIVRASAKQALVWKFVFRRATYHPETFRILGCILYIVLMSPEQTR